jgi:SAM-dependent methyltransferase
MLAERLFQAALAGLELCHIYLGDKLGLYRALADHGPCSSAELSAATGLAERYLREWLEQQAVAGVLDVAADAEEPSARRFALDAALVPVLLDAEHPLHYLPLAQGVVAVTQTLPAVLDAFRTGGGVPYADYGADLRRFVSRINRPMYANQLGSEWLPALPDVHARLCAEPPARVADVGCGTGWSTIALARAYPKARVEGFDLDDASIAEARSNAEAAGVAERVQFTHADAGAIPTQPYDLVCAFETLHDMADPIRALRHLRTLAGSTGAVLVADEKVAESFTAPGDELERFNYGWSALHCLAVGLTEPHAAGTGTVIRPGVVRDYALAAGFADVEILPIEHDLWRFYRLET